MTRLEASDPASPSTAVAGCIEACRRCDSLVELILVEVSSVTDRAYAVVGPHLRHCLDHFDCLFNGLDAGVVDYARERDVRLEQEPVRCREVLRSIVTRLAKLTPGDEGQRLRVRQSAAPGGRTAEVESNLGRELAFLSGHTIHHLAIMKLLAEAAGVVLPKGLDLAFSTEAFLDNSVQPT
jgi:hypothetical protein